MLDRQNEFTACCPRLVKRRRVLLEGIPPRNSQPKLIEADELISCAGSGQDGEIRSGVQWPEPRFEEAGSMVVDRLTNLC